MNTRITKLTSAMGLAVGLGIAFTPLGCGGSSQEVGMELSDGAGEGPQAPAETVARVTDCVNEAKARLTDTVYSMQFNVEVTESGHAGRVRLKDSSPSERGLESCIAHALEGMTSPVPVLRLISQQPVSPESRGLLGQPAPAVVVVPIFLIIATFTVIVQVYLHVSAETAEAERCKKIKKKCINRCTDEELPTGQYDGMPYHKCLRACLESYGCWGKTN